jgi:hypothetical protein
MKMSKTAILPIVTVVLGGITIITGHKFSESTPEFIAAIAAVVVGGGINIWGIIKNHK